MRKSYELLLKFRYDTRYAFSRVQVCYIDRGAPGNQSCVSGDQILALNAGHMEIASDWGVKYIPYHRIIKILYTSEVVWDR
jgi:uncharacterized protein (UPF0248 family)